jgi:hypothetical protein
VGMTSLLAKDEAKLLLSWLAIGEAAVAIWWPLLLPVLKELGE